MSIINRRTERKRALKIAIENYIYKERSYSPGIQMSFAKFRTNGNDTQKALVDSLDVWIEETVLADYYTRKALIDSAENQDALNAIGLDFSSNDGTDPEINLKQVLDAI